MLRRRRPERDTRILDNSALRAALEAGGDDPEGDRAVFFRSLADSELLVMLQEPEDAAAAVGAGLQCIMFEQDGEVVLPVFTDLESLHRFQRGHPHWTTAPAKTLCRLGTQGQFDRMVINPAGPVSYALAPGEMQSLAEGLTPTSERRVVAERGAELTVGMPAERLSQKVLDEMREAAAAPGVQEAWWCWMAIGGGQPHLAIAVDPPDFDLFGTVADRIAPIWRAYKPSNPLFDVLELNDGIRKNGELLFRRQTEAGAPAGRPPNKRQQKRYSKRR